MTGGPRQPPGQPKPSTLAGAATKKGERGQGRGDREQGTTQAPQRPQAGKPARHRRRSAQPRRGRGEDGGRRRHRAGGGSSRPGGAGRTRNSGRRRQPEAAQEDRGVARRGSAEYWRPAGKIAPRRRPTANGRSANRKPANGGPQAAQPSAQAVPRRGRGPAADLRHWEPAKKKRPARGRARQRCQAGAQSRGRGGGPDRPGRARGHPQRTGGAAGAGRARRAPRSRQEMTQPRQPASASTAAPRAACQPARPVRPPAPPWSSRLCPARRTRGAGRHGREGHQRRGGGPGRP